MLFSKSYSNIHEKLLPIANLELLCKYKIQENFNFTLIQVDVKSFKSKHTLVSISILQTTQLFNIYLARLHIQLLHVFQVLLVYEHNIIQKIWQKTINSIRFSFEIVDII